MTNLRNSNEHARDPVCYDLTGRDTLYMIVCNNCTVTFASLQTETDFVLSAKWPGRARSS